jgi:hypothetical protein
VDEIRDDSLPNGSLVLPLQQRVRTLDMGYEWRICVFLVINEGMSWHSVFHVWQSWATFVFEVTMVQGIGLSLSLSLVPLFHVFQNCHTVHLLHAFSWYGLTRYNPCVQFLRGRIYDVCKTNRKINACIICYHVSALTVARSMCQHICIMTLGHWFVMFCSAVSAV